MKYLRWAGVVIGFAMVTLVIRQVGAQTILNTLILLKWKFLIVLAYPLSWIVLNSIGWRYACHPDQIQIPLRKMVEIRLAGETFNSLLPSGYVGGEPVKAKLLSRWTSLREAASSVLIAKAAQSIGMLLFIGLGLVVGLPSSAESSDKVKAWLALGLLSLGVGLFTVLLANRSFSRLIRVLYTLTRWPKVLAWELKLAALDESLGTFYQECKGRYFTSVLWHGVGWIIGMLELVLIFALMGHPISWRSAWFMGALAQLGSVIGLISPGGLGFYEGGHYMAAVLLGLPPELGVSASLIRRVREIFWDSVGLYFFNKYSKTTP